MLGCRVMPPDIYPIAYAQEEFLAWNQVQISPLDRGFLFGEGLYATIAVIDGEPLFCEQHLERLALSCQQLNFPRSNTDFEKIVRKIIALNHLETAGVSLIITRGVDKVRNHIPTAQTPTILAFASPWKPSATRRPILVDLQEDPRPEGYAHLKMNSLLPNVQASQKACNTGFDKVLFHRNGIIIEAAQANLFWIRNQQLYTPASDLPMVGGITRLIVLQIAAELGLTVHEGHYPIQVLKHADEAFLCASLSQITPIRQIACWEYTFEPEITRQIAQMYQTSCEKEVLRQKYLQEEKARG